MSNREPLVDELNGVKQDTIQWDAKAHRVTILDSNGNELGIDRVTNSLQTIISAHHEIHLGNHYSIEGCATLGNGSELRIKLIAPNTSKRIHILWEINSSGILTTELYENSSGGMTGGVNVNAINNNRNSDNSSEMILTSGVSEATDDGDLISQACWGSRQLGGGNKREDEIILKQDTIYLRKFISGTNGNLVYFKAIWYEHTNEN